MQAPRQAPKQVQAQPGRRPVRHAPVPHAKGKGGPARVVPKQTSRRARWPVAWGGTGFVLGALFGQAFGFWSFVSEVVLYAAPMAGAKFALADANAATFDAGPEMALQAVLLVDPANCTALVLDRTANSTATGPCPTTGLALRLERDGTRADLAADALPSVQSATYRAD